MTCSPQSKIYIQRQGNAGNEKDHDFAKDQRPITIRAKHIMLETQDHEKTKSRYHQGQTYTVWDPI